MAEGVLTTAIGHAEGSDPGDVADRILRQLDDQLGAVDPDAGILMADVDFRGEILLRAVLDKYPGIQLIGGTTSGVFSSAFGFSEFSAGLMVFASDHIRFRASLGSRISDDPDGAITRAFNRFDDNDIHRDKICIVIPDGTATRIPDVLLSLKDRLSSDCVVVGGV